MDLSVEATAEGAEGTAGSLVLNAEKRMFNYR
jgi:hypothetical protein